MYFACWQSVLADPHQTVVHESVVKWEIKIGKLSKSLFVRVYILEKVENL